MNCVASSSAISVLFLTFLSANAESPEAEIPVLRNGSKGEHVKLAQTLLGINSDGDFGDGTKSAVEEFQRKHSLRVDGVIGSSTWKELRGSGEFVYIQGSGELRRGMLSGQKGILGRERRRMTASRKGI